MRRALTFLLLGLAVGPALGIVILSLGLWPWRGTSAPPKWETTLARKSLHAAVSHEAANLKSPMTVSDELLLSGIRIYRANCAGCHGDFSQPSAWGTNGFYPWVPQFADSPPDLRSEEMFLIVRNGIRYSGMGAWKDLMSEEDTWKVVTFLSTIKSLPPTVRETWEKPKQTTAN